MEKFNEYFTVKEQTEDIPIEDMRIVILGYGDADGTFANLLKKVAKKKNIFCELIDVDEAFIADSDVEIGKVTIQNYDGEDNSLDIETSNTLIFVRGGAVESLTSQSLVSSLQTIGFFLVNDLEAMMLCSNKMSNAIALERNNINIPKTSIVNNVKSIEDAHRRIGGKFPVIIKTLTGTQGVGVSKVNDMSSLVSVCQSLWKYDASILLQEFLDVGSDVRTLLVNGKIIGAAERIRQKEDKDFRNNVHLGAETKPYKLSDEEKELVIKAARSSGASYCGVDHCVYKGQAYILEVNGSPGIRSHFMGYDYKTQKPTKKISDEETIQNILEIYSDERARRALMRQEAGYIESIILEGMENDPIRAKFDTGNSASATMLHVDSMEADGDYVKWSKNGSSFKSEVLYVSEPKRGLKPFDRRPVIEHTIIFNNKRYNAEIGLSTKDTASEMLVNRKLMTKFKVAINPNKRFILSDVVEANDSTDH